MNFNKSDSILLVGEANFSFTISLLNHLTPLNTITTCYESNDQLKKLFGDILDNNLKILKNARIAKILFSVDACSLESNDYLLNCKFDKIVFMFPHVGGKSNLKKNRLLLDGFLKSCKTKLKPNGCIYLGLARGQGGTKFEVGVKKSNDNWQVLNFANKNGYVLTQAEQFDEKSFIYYKSTGFRSGNRSFHVENAIIHKLELSLPLSKPLSDIHLEVEARYSIKKLNDSDKNQTYSFLMDYLSKSIQIYQAECGMTSFVSSLVHIFNEFNQLLLLNSMKIVKSTNFAECYLTKDGSHRSNYHLNEPCLKLINEKLSTDLKNQNLYIKNHFKIDDFYDKCKDLNQVNVFSALLPTTRGLTNSNELFNLKYQALYLIKTSETTLKNCFKSCLNQFTGKFNLAQSNEFIQLNENDESLQAIIDFTHICTRINHLSDKRLLLSDDVRNFSNGFLVQPFVKETLIHMHDVSFWFNKEAFMFEDFLDVIRDTCGSLVRRVNLIDSYEDQHATNTSKKHSLTYRILHESCDHAFDWEESRKVQDCLREALRDRLKFIIK